MRIWGRKSGWKGSQAQKQNSVRVGGSLTLNRQGCPGAPRPRVQTLGHGHTASQVAGQQLVLLATRQSLTHSSDSVKRSVLPSGPGVCEESRTLLSRLSSVFCCYG